MPGDRPGADPQATPATASRPTVATPRKLAELLRADLLTAVHPPTIDQEAVRDLCRAREDAVTDRTRARHRLAKLLLRRGIAYDGRNWTLRHRRWLLTLRFEHPAAQATFDDYLRALEGVEERLRTLEQELAACAASDDSNSLSGWRRAGSVHGSRYWGPVYSSVSCLLLYWMWGEPYRWYGPARLSGAAVLVAAAFVVGRFHPRASAVLVFYIGVPAILAAGTLATCDNSSSYIAQPKAQYGQYGGVY